MHKIQSIAHRYGSRPARARLSVLPLV